MEPDVQVLLVEWWTAASDDGEHVGRWFEARGGGAAREHGLAMVDGAWTRRVRISLLVHDQPTAAVDVDRSGLEVWDVETDTLPAHCLGPPLPPRSPDDIRREVVCGCRDALALGLRARLLDRGRIVELLHEIDRSFDPGMLQSDGD